MHILFLSPRFPLPPIKGDKLRAWQFIRLLSKHCRVTLLTYIETPEEYERMAEMEQYCAVTALPFARPQRAAGMFRALAARRPFQAALFESREMKQEVKRLLGNVDAIHCNTLRIAGNVPADCSVPVVVDFIDALSTTYDQAARSSHFPLSNAFRGELRRLKAWQAELVERAALSMAVSPADARALGPGVEVVRHSVDTHAFSPPPPDEPRAREIVFTGNLSYRPNVEAAHFLATKVFPLTRELAPGARLRIVGADPRHSVEALASDHIEVTGFVPDMPAVLRRAGVAAAPLTSGSGVKTKVLEAMSCGAPVVATPFANEGIDAEDGRHLLLAEEAEEFARQAASLLNDPKQAAVLGRAGRQFIEDEFSWESAGARLWSLYSRIAPKPVLDESAAPGEAG